MTTMRLSICIPTHNFGRFLADALVSIRSQYVHGTEVLIFDGGSTDNTREIVERYQADCPYVRYHFQPVKGGIDADLAKSVELAKGEYCWLLSADDALADGALKRIHRELDSGRDVYLCNRVLCDIDLRPGKPQSWLSGGPADAEFKLSDNAAVSSYLERAMSIGALFSYMSTIIVRRKSLLQVAQEPAMMGTNYALAHRLFSMRVFGGEMKYLGAPLVLCRGGNDSFLSLGLVGRHLIDLRGFRMIAESVFSGAPQLQQRFKEVVNREHGWRTWLWLRSVTKDDSDWARIRAELPHFGYWKVKILLLECIAARPGVLRVILSIVNLLRRIISRRAR